jgi:putative proteasome-type protease
MSDGLMWRAKYGKPILDRVLQLGTSLERVALCGLVSMAATIRSNLTVGPPVELCLIDAGSLQPGRYLSFDVDDNDLHELRQTWNGLMQESFDKLQPLSFPVLRRI